MKHKIDFQIKYPMKVWSVINRGKFKGFVIMKNKLGWFDLYSPEGISCMEKQVSFLDDIMKTVNS